MNHEQVPASEDGTPRDYVDRWPMKIISTDIRGQPTTNHDEVMQFMKEYSGCDFQMRNMPDEQGQNQLYMVALPPRSDGSDHYSI